MSKEKTVSVLNELIFHSIIHGSDAGGSYDQNEEYLIAAINNAINYFELFEYEIGEQTNKSMPGWATLGLVRKE